MHIRRFICVFQSLVFILNIGYSQCASQLLFDFEVSVDDWDGNGTYSFGQSNTSFESKKSLFAKMELEANGSFLRKGVFTTFEGQVQDWSDFNSMKFDFKFVDLATDQTTIGRPPARLDGSRVIYIELIEQGGEKFKYEFSDTTNNWHQREVHFSQFVRRGGSDNPPGDASLNQAAITMMAFHVLGQNVSFTEVIRLDDIELVFKPENCPVTPLLSDIAQVYDLPKGAPKYSDVCLSSRYRRFLGHNRYQVLTESAIDSFHPTRLDWIYVNDQSYIKDVVETYGLTYSGTLNNKLPDVVGGTVRQLGRCVTDSSGSMFIWPWMDQNSGQYVGTVNAQAFKDIYMDHARMYYDSVQTSLNSKHLAAIQMDDPGFNYVLALTGNGCYSPATGVETIDEAFVSTSAFYQEMQSLMKTESGNPNLGFSMNNDGNKFNKRVIVDAFDFAMGELYSEYSNPDSLYQITKRARSLDKMQIFSPVRYRPTDAEYNDDNLGDFYYNPNDSDHIRQGRQSIANAYAVGSNHLVPWDTWFHGSIRHFGYAKDYADLFGMVRAIPFYLDSYEDAAFFTPNPSLVEDRYDDQQPVSVTSSNGNIAAFARAKPGDTNAPIIIHLVNWGAGPANLTVNLLHDYFSIDGQFDVEYITPKPYSVADHDMARDSATVLQRELRGAYQYSAFSHLVQRTAQPISVLDQAKTSVQLSSLDVWGILVIKPTQECQDILVESNYPLIASSQQKQIKINTNGTVAVGDLVEYTAGQSIECNSGFQVLCGASFHAYINSCQ